MACRNRTGNGAVVTDAAVVEEPLEVRLFIELRIRPDRLDPELLAYYKNEAEAAGFPPSDENAAWYFAEDVANEASQPGCRAEVNP